MDKYELIRSMERFFYYDMVHHISELYSGALPDGHTFTKSMIDGIIRNTINNGIDKKLITDGVIGETKIHRHPIIDENGNCYEYEYEEYLDVDYNITSLSTKQVIEYMKLRVELKTFDPPPDFKKHFLGMSKSEPAITGNENTISALQQEQETLPPEPKPDIIQNVAGSAISCYRFVKADKGWNLQFEDVVLNGVKDWTGMSYIRILLQNPDQDISVIKLQGLAGTGDPEPSKQGYYNIADYDSPEGGIPAWETSDKKAIQEYKVQISIIENKLKEARACKVQNKSKIERLEKDKAAYESQLNEASYQGKDPKVDKARKSVLKVIADTIKSIRKLEELCNYNDKPISSHFSRYIKTGASCSYVTSGDNPPSWQF